MHDFDDNQMQGQADPDDKRRQESEYGHASGVLDGVKVVCTTNSDLRHQELAALSAEAGNEAQANNDDGDETSDENDRKTSLIDLLNDGNRVGTVALVRGECVLGGLNNIIDILVRMVRGCIYGGKRGLNT